MSKVILVDVNDKVLGLMDKLVAHKSMQLHRAYSFLLFVGPSSMLIQRRALSKSAFAGLWTNACCSHPAHLDEFDSELRVRIRQELLMEYTNPIKYIGRINYSADASSQAIENSAMPDTLKHNRSQANSVYGECEMDYIFVGHVESIAKVTANAEEVMETMIVEKDKLKKWIEKEPQMFTPWFHILHRDFLNVKIKRGSWINSIVKIPSQAILYYPR